MYRITNSRQARRRRSRLGLALVVIGLLSIGGVVIATARSVRQPPVIKQAKAVVTKVSYSGKLKHYDEDNFGIDLPSTWQPVPRPPYTYQSFTWQSTDNGSQQIEIYEDTIPTKLPVNRALAIRGASDHVELDGAASDNCVNFTKDLGVGQSEDGIHAKWRGVDFLCDHAAVTRDVIGTSSVDGVNVVNLKTTNGTAHSFFFTYTDKQLNPDYSVFYSALTSFGMH